jgi:pimeloyl-ACP methyl ester carboxylesterase
VSDPARITLADGRTLSYLDGGDPDGVPVVGLHGTPGCRLNRVADDSLYARAGVRYVTTDRAGYGQSSRHHGRSVADEAADVGALADALGWARFSVLGGSGGGPHALACGALLADRVDRVACQSGLAPLGPDGLERHAWLDGMSPDIAEELVWAEAGEAVLEREIVTAQLVMEQRIATDPAALLGDGLSAGDREFLVRPEVVERFALIIAEQCAHGVGGPVDDTLALTRPWGFSVAEVDVPVLLTYGLEDVSVPPAHGRWLAARLPDVRVIESASGGHLPEDPQREIADTFAWLRTGELPTSR